MTTTVDARQLPEASLVDSAETVIALAGFLLPGDLSEPGQPQVLVAEDQVIAVSPPLADFLDWATAPRLWRQATEWIQERGGEEAELDALVQDHVLVRVDPGTPSQVVAAFAGLRLVPMGAPRQLPDADDLVFVGRDDDSSELWPISVLLAAVMWTSVPGEDFPATVGRLGAEGSMEPDSGARMALYGLSGLLSLRLARWERVGQ